MRRAASSNIWNDMPGVECPIHAQGIEFQRMERHAWRGVPYSCAGQRVPMYGTTCLAWSAIFMRRAASSNVWNDMPGVECRIHAQGSEFQRMKRHAWHAVPYSCAGQRVPTYGTTCLAWSALFMRTAASSNVWNDMPGVECRIHAHGSEFQRMERHAWRGVPYSCARQRVPTYGTTCLAWSALFMHRAASSNVWNDMPGVECRIHAQGSEFQRMERHAWRGVPYSCTGQRVPTYGTTCLAWSALFMHRAASSNVWNDMPGVECRIHAHGSGFQRMERHAWRGVPYSCSGQRVPAYGTTCLAWSALFMLRAASSNVWNDMPGVECPIHAQGIEFQCMERHAWRGVPYSCAGHRVPMYGTTCLAWSALFMRRASSSNVWNDMPGVECPIHAQGS